MFYDPKTIEEKWQKKWEEAGLYKADDFSNKGKKYILIEFPYPSGAGLHVGHVRSYTALDVFCRKLRMQGKNVLYPIGWDAFGLPTENYAIKNKIHPRLATEQNICTFTKQMKSLGISFDWSREIDTTDPNYYKWTQWIFLKLYEHGLAYKANIPINWCPSCKIGLANEEVVNGKCERCGAETEKRQKEQWMLAITKYADRLIDDLETVDYLEKIKSQQINWIGRSEGAIIKFKIPIKWEKFVNTKFRLDVKSGIYTRLRQNENIKHSREGFKPLAEQGDNAEMRGLKTAPNEITSNEITALDRITWFITFSTKQRMPVFQTKEQTQTMINLIFNSCLNHNFTLHEIAVMPDHLHIIVDTPKDIPVEKIYKYLKGYSSKKFIEKFGSKWSDGKGNHLWTPKGDYSIIESEKQYADILRYAQNNPAKRNLPIEPRLLTLNFNHLYTELEVFTTRPDTLFGCTYMVVSPEHEIIKKLKPQIQNFDKVGEYLDEAEKKSDLQRTEAKEKTGVEIKGLRAINYVRSGIYTRHDDEYVRSGIYTRHDEIVDDIPHDVRGLKTAPNEDDNNKEIPIFVADYVLSGYGTGAIMAVPAHDERDFEFAKKYGLAIREVVAPKNSNTKTPSNEEVFDVREDSCPRREIWNCHLDNSINDNKNNVKSQNGAEPAEGFEPSDLGMTIPDPHHAAGTNTPNSLYQKNNAISNNFFSGEGISVNSEFLNGLKTEEAKEKMIEWLEENGAGKREVQYKLRDWVFSRQRYWGEPIPLVFCPSCKKLTENFKFQISNFKSNQKSKIKINNLEFNLGEILNPGWIADESLPVQLPKVKSYEPTETGESPLANITDWVNTTCPKCGGAAKRETDTMPNWAGSSWYFLRYIDPKNDNVLADPEKLKYWMPVDLYNGGMEHTTLHLLYSRFWNKFLYDIGVVPTSEPYARRVSHGMILAEDGKKMSKSLGNVINPDDVVRKFGADALRVYEMFMGPYGESIPWSADGLKGVRRFLDRVWGMGCRIMNYEFPPEALRPPMAGDQPLAERIMNGEQENFKSQFPSTRGDRGVLNYAREGHIKSLLHKTIKKVTEDIDNFKFNTAISAMMILVNELEREEVIDAEDYKSLLLILSPFAPHICEELWENLTSPQPSSLGKLGTSSKGEGESASPPLRSGQGEVSSIFTQPWPSYDPELAKDEKTELIIQINGKMRDKFIASADILEEDAKKLAFERKKVNELVKGREVVKVVFVPAKLINIVIK